MLLEEKLLPALRKSQCTGVNVKKSSDVHKLPFYVYTVYIVPIFFSMCTCNEKINKIRVL